MYPLSLPQQAFFLDSIKHGSTTKYNMGIISEIRGPIDAYLFRSSLEFALDVHDIRRMRVRFDGDSAVQDSLPEGDCPNPFVQVDLSEHANPVEAAVGWILEDYAVPMPLTDAPLHGDVLLRLGDELYFWYQKFQHISNDAWGLSVVNETIGLAYNELLKTGRLPDLKRYSYIDFIDEDIAYARSDRYRADEAFWAGKFPSMPEPLPFTKRKRGLSAPHTLLSERCTLEIGREIFNAIAERCREEGVSPAQFLLAALFSYLSRLSGLTDIVVGTPILNRSNHDFKRTAGLFMGMMPLRMTIDGEASLFGVASAIRSETISCYRHQRFPVGEIIRRCRTMEGFCHGVYDVSFIYRDVNFNTVFGNSTSRTISLDPAARDDTLSIEVDNFDDTEAVNIIFNYNPILISPAEARGMMWAFENLLGTVAAGKNPLVRDFMLTPPDPADAPVTSVDSREGTVLDLIWRRAAETPDAPAVVCGGSKISYTELTRLAGCVASCICGAFDAAPEEPVAVLGDRGVESIVAMLGILKAGCAYLPIDPETPQDRIEFILKDSACRIILAGDRYRQNKVEGIRTLPITEAMRYTGQSVLHALSMRNLAYIIYTSGTTGRPKGVLIEHSGFLNTITELVRGWEMTSGDRMLGFASPMFDASIVEYFLPLSSGGCLVLARKEEILDPARFIELLRNERVSVAMLSPTYLSALGRIDMSPLRLLGTAGEEANPADVAYHVRYRTFVNAYGPTEITIISNYLKLDAGTEFSAGRVPVGKPIGGMNCLILDEELRPLPAGEIGEIFIGGSGVARGYLGRPELTSERFIVIPVNDGERMYRSGDLGRMLPDGSLEFHGRRDSQVKIRGYRVELGEIETVIKTHPSVETAVVLKRSGSDILVAYVVPHAGFDPAEIRQFLSSRLPAYMVPNGWVRLRAFPVNTSGKVRHDLLEAMAESVESAVRPVSDDGGFSSVRQTLQEIWSEVLDGVKVGPDDDFFMLGGHSLKAIEMMSRLHDRLGIRLEMSDFFDNPTVTGLVAAIERRRGIADRPVIEDVGCSSVRQTLQEIWSEILDGVKVGPDDDFFMLGGHSLKAIEMMSRLHDRLGIRLEMSDFFDNPTVAGLVAAVECRNVSGERTESASAVIGPALPPPVVHPNSGVMLQKETVSRLLRKSTVSAPEDGMASYGKLSSLQERLWLVQKLAPESIAYIIPLHLHIRGGLDLQVLKDSIGCLWVRHDSLRAAFPVIDGRPRRVTLPTKLLDLRLYDFSREDNADGWKEHYLGSCLTPFNMEDGPLFRAVIYILGADEYAVMIDVHHINIDGASLDILRSELFSIYESLLDGKQPDLPPVNDGYDVYVEHENAIRAGASYKKALDERVRQLSGAPLHIDFCFDHQAPESFSYRGGILLKESEGIRQHKQVCEIAEKTGVTPFSIYLAAFGTMLYLHTGQEDILVGIPASLRTSGRFERTVGFFVNTCVARLDFSGNPTLLDLIKRAGLAVRDMLRTHEVSFEHLVHALCKKRQQARPPLVQASLSYMFSEEEGATVVRGLTIDPMYLLRKSAMFELTMDIFMRTDGGFNVLEYSADVWEEATVRRMHEHFLLILDAYTASPGLRVGEINLLRGAMIEALEKTLEGGALDTFVQTVPDQVIGYANMYPDRTAIISKGIDTSYAMLRRLVSRRRGKLRELGMGRGDVLALVCRPGLEWTISSLSAMAEGVAVVPLDIGIPSERLFHIINNSGARLLWHDGVFPLASDWNHPSCRCLECREAYFGSSVEGPATARPSDTAYIIYTSGSTGLPKGVRVSHGAFEAHCRSAAEAYGLTAADCSLVFAPPYVDASWEQLFASLAVGGTVLVREAQIWAPDEWCRQVMRFRATCVDIPAQYLQELLFYWNIMPECVPDCLRLVICGGEPMPVSLAKAWLNGPLSQIPLINAYGPTEGVVTATFHFIETNSRIETVTAVVPIGVPMPGRILRVLDAHGREAGAGIAGELCIGGPCLADGYVGDEDRTASAFRCWLRTPDGGRWAEPEEPRSMRLYRTGDRVRIGYDGLVEFLGRIDRQFQIRGFRVEPGEIEALLVNHAAIDRALVVAKDDQLSVTRLAAYCVPVPGGNAPSGEELQEWLSRWLPGHMIPDSFIFMAGFPTTANDKVDVAALPLPEIAQSRETPPSRGADKIESCIAGIWCDVLGRNHVGLNENFFDIGGQSILLLRVHSRLQSELGCTIPLVDLFANPTVSRLAKRLRGDIEVDHVRQEHESHDDVAVIGMAGRFPGAADIDRLWENLVAGRESIRFYTREELASAGVPSSLAERPDYVPAHGFMEGTGLFDPGFFGYTPREAETIDPQQRLFLEEAWHALEHAGYDPGRYRGDIGVYAGVGMNIYLLSNLASFFREGHGSDSYAISLSNDKDFITSRVSYKLDLRGPSVNVNTACSTSLVAIHMAAHAILAGECDMALAGGVTLQLKNEGYLFQPEGIMSPDGHCRAFADDAAGTVGGSGGAVVVLKRFRDALADGDTIHAVIKGSAINNDGADKVGFTAPGVHRQRDVIRAALHDAGVRSTDIGYVEAHGTGTSIGDPIEVEALTEAFAPWNPESGSCYIGSIKSNIGHLDTAGGIAGFIKTVMAVKNGVIPPSLNCGRPSRRIDFGNTPFQVACKLTPWPGTGIRLAGVSSFGMGGTNAHLILQEPPESVRHEPMRKDIWCIPVSARSIDSLKAQAEKIATHIEMHPDIDANDLWFTLSEGRRLHGVRAVFVADSNHAAATALRVIDEKDILRTDRDGHQLSGTGLPGIQALEGSPEFTGVFRFARAWLAGDLEQTSKLLPDGPNRRIPLPGYEFDHKHYWVEDQSREIGQARGGSDSPRKLPLEEWFHLPGWERVPLRSSAAAGIRPVLLIHEGGAVAERFEDALRAAGVPLIACHGGEGLGGRLSGIASNSGLPSTCWHISALALRPAGAEAYAFRLGHLLEDISVLASAIGENGMELTLFSPMHAGGPDACPEPSYAYLEAVCAVIPHEIRRLQPRVLRLDPTCIDSGSVVLAAEAARLDAGDRVIALSNGRLWRRTYAKYAPEKPDAENPCFVERGVYLITGGTGGIGLTVAGHLARTCRARLVLLSRNGLDASAREAVMAMEAAGAEVKTVIADVADTTAVRVAVDDACALWGRIDGVIHAAGVGGGSLIAGTSLTEIERVIGAKVAGTLALAAALQGREPRFVLLCSSLTATLGGPGQAAYAAANAWLDAWAESQGERRPGIWKSLQWDSWASVGMAARLASTSAVPSINSINSNAVALLRSWTISPDTYWPWGEHLVNGVAMLPGTAYLELFVQALSAQWPVALGSVTMSQPMIQNGTGARVVNVLRDGNELVLQSHDGNLTIEHARARLEEVVSLPAVDTPEAVKARCMESVDVASVRPERSGDGSYVVEAGSRWKIDGDYWKGNGEAFSIFELPANFAGDLVEHPLHPALLDVAISYYISFVEEGMELLPWQYGKVTVLAPLTQRLASCVKMRSRSGRALVLDVNLFDDSGRALLRIEGYTLVRPGTSNEADSSRRAGSRAGNPFALTPAEGIEVFLRAIASPEPLCCISTVDWKHAANPAAPETESGGAGRGKDAGPNRKPRPEQETLFRAPRSRGEELMAQVWCEVLGYAGLGIDDDLFELGADSLSALQAMVRIEEMTGSPFSMERFFSGPTIAALASEIDGKSPDGNRLVAIESIVQWEEGEL